MFRSIVLFVVLSVILSVAWPFLTRFGIGRLPGDITFERNGRRYHLPIASLVVISLVVTLLLRLVGR